MTYENKSLRCRNCKFWWPIVEGDDQRAREHAIRGQCRRHAPPPVSADQEWAITRNADWCGEHTHVQS